MEAETVENDFRVSTPLVNRRACVFDHSLVLTGVADFDQGIRDQRSDEEDDNYEEDGHDSNSLIFHRDWHEPTL